GLLGVGELLLGGAEEVGGGGEGLEAAVGRELEQIGGERARWGAAEQDGAVARDRERRRQAEPEVEGRRGVREQLVVEGGPGHRGPRRVAGEEGADQSAGEQAHRASLLDRFTGPAATGAVSQARGGRAGWRFS